MTSLDAYFFLIEEGEPSTFENALNSPNASLWMTTMQEKLEALHRNKMWELVPLREGWKAIGNKWVYKIKRDGNDQVEWYCSRLVVKGFAQCEHYILSESFFKNKKNKALSFDLNPNSILV